ncbi:hypothetical protein QNO07_20890 [Streptomyces sp. 549]|uniref:hypothetical protein n=1 Tax=Streptomyces sp. 549 TaxID=3049076 RepID=UPI0024C262A9|nr:hypothetical protein [Streptomyces sp. 549]MDK1475844.1 hypothetical protein [Streptomyces sp. 549]
MSNHTSHQDPSLSASEPVATPVPAPRTERPTIHSPRIAAQRPEVAAVLRRIHRL